MTACAARSGLERPADEDQTALVRSAGECLLTAAEQYSRAAEAPEGPIRDSFLEMADEWPRLAGANPLLVNIWLQGLSPEA